MAEEKKRVTRDDVLSVLIKHAPTPNDPDDADTLARFQQQEADKAAGVSDDDDDDTKETGPQTKPATPKGKP